jgi:type I restriction-modification system DNA methylase subunit
MCQESLSVSDSRNGDLERRRELGQFFTSPPVAGFIWDLLEVIHGGRFQVNTRLIDPACGEGVFLRVAHERGGLPAKNLFGADIDASLAPGWNQDPFLRKANLMLANGLLDDPMNGVRENAFDIVAGNPPFSGKGLRDLLRLLDEPAEGITRHEEQDFFKPVASKRKHRRHDSHCLARSARSWIAW